MGGEFRPTLRDRRAAQTSAILFKPGRHPAPSRCVTRGLQVTETLTDLLLTRAGKPFQSQPLFQALGERQRRQRADSHPWSGHRGRARRQGQKTLHCEMHGSRGQVLRGVRGQITVHFLCPAFFLPHRLCLTLTYPLHIYLLGTI